MCCSTTLLASVRGGHQGNEPHTLGTHVRVRLQVPGNLDRNWTVSGMTIFGFRDSRAVSVTAATSRGVAGLVKDAEMGEDVIVERHGRVVAAVVSVDHFEQLKRMRADVSSAPLILAREFTGTGTRTSLVDAFSSFGLDRADLEAELDADLAAGRP